MNKDKIKKYLNNVLWIFFTNRCTYCGEFIDKNKTLCDDCAENLPVIKGEKCRYCGAEKSRCKCKKHKLNFDGITAPFYYEDGIKSAVKRLKFNRKIFLADILSTDMVKAIKTDFSDKSFDFICFVPFSKAQLVTRMYNQSELLAENISLKMNIPLKRVMVKLFETKSQHKMSMRSRKGNVFGVYDVKNPEEVKGKTILLVDDVKTSGSTLDDCATILKIRGAAEVYCVAAAIAGAKPKEKNDENEKTES